MTTPRLPEDDGAPDDPGERPYAHRPRPGPDPWDRPRGARTPPPRGGPVFNAIPGVVLGLCAVILVGQLLDTLSAGGTYHRLSLWLGALATGDLRQQFPTPPLGGLTPYVLHVFVHAGWLHAAINTMALLAFGAAAARPFGRGWRAAAGFLAFFFAAAIGGAVLHQLVFANEASYMVGASTAVSGVLAGAGWASGGRAGMMQLALPWLAVNMLLALLGLAFFLPIAWAGHVGGLAVGVFFYPAFVAAFRRRRF
ncbi:rhomboid family intramembrane serine protease [Marinicauda salina]|nr:rhomboid family intramembrane serine protease [Marinicauda salina]